MRHSPLELPATGGGTLTACRGAVRGFSLEISRCTRFSRLMFRNIRATRAPMFVKLLNTLTRVQAVDGERDGSLYKRTAKREKNSAPTRVEDCRLYLVCFLFVYCGNTQGWRTAQINYAVSYIHYKVNVSSKVAHQDIPYLQYGVV